MSTKNKQNTKGRLSSEWYFSVAKILGGDTDQIDQIISILYDDQDVLIDNELSVYIGTREEGRWLSPLEIEAVKYEVLKAMIHTLLSYM